MPLTEEQSLLFEDYLKEARDTYPDALDYTLQLLCYKLVRDGNLDTECTEEEREEIKSKYMNAPTLVYSD